MIPNLTNTPVKNSTVTATDAAGNTGSLTVTVLDRTESASKTPPKEFIAALEAAFPIRTLRIGE